MQSVRAVIAMQNAALGQMTVWSTTQSPQILRRLLARFLGLADRVVALMSRQKGMVLLFDSLRGQVGRVGTAATAFR